jgi:hypothetical protein
MNHDDAANLPQIQSQSTPPNCGTEQKCLAPNDLGASDSPAGQAEPAGKAAKSGKKRQKLTPQDDANSSAATFPSHTTSGKERPKRRKGQDELLVALAAGRTFKKAALEAGVSERTARSRWAEPEFQKRLVFSLSPLAGYSHLP